MKLETIKHKTRNIKLETNVAPSSKLQAPSSCGFTLIELLVSLAIFAIVMTISTGSVLTIVDANKKSQALSAVMNNVAIALEGMSRAMRVGDGYDCGGLNGDCGSNGSSSFEFVSQEGEEVVYTIDEVTHQITRQVNGGTPVPVTAPEVTITELTFYSVGIESGDGEQPRVIIVVKGEAGQGTAVTEFSLQTTVSRRMLDS